MIQTMRTLQSATKLRWVIATVIWAISIVSFIIWATVMGLEGDAGISSVLGLMILMCAGSFIVPEPLKTGRKSSWRWSVPNVVVIVMMVGVVMIALLVGNAAAFLFTMGLTASIGTVLLVVRCNALYNWLR